jgi:hypothetical protein
MNKEAVPLPPPNSFSTALTNRILTMTAKRDNELLGVYQSVYAGETPAIDRAALMEAIKAKWRVDIEAACIEALAHADNLVETVKALHTQMNALRAAANAVWVDR